jgi:hypothetical protein
MVTIAQAIEVHATAHKMVSFNLFAVLGAVVVIAFLASFFFDKKKPR